MAEVSKSSWNLKKVNDADEFAAVASAVKLKTIVIRNNAIVRKQTTRLFPKMNDFLLLMYPRAESGLIVWMKY